MDYDRRSNGWVTFLEHWWLLFVIVVAVVTSQVLMFFENLSGVPWIYFFVASFVLLLSGAALIVYAKFPVYRSGRFFTLGVKSVPEQRAGCYCWAWRIVLFGVVLSLCLLLSKQ